MCHQWVRRGLYCNSLLKGWLRWFFLLSGLDTFIQMAGGVGNGDYGWLGFGEGSIVDEVGVVDVGVGSGRWASGGHVEINCWDL